MTSGRPSGTSTLRQQRSYCHIPGCMSNGVASRFGEGSCSAVWDLCAVPSLKLLPTGQTLTYCNNFQGHHQIGWGLEHRKSDTRLQELFRLQFMLGRNSLGGALLVSTNTWWDDTEKTGSGSAQYCKVVVLKQKR